MNFKFLRTRNFPAKFQRSLTGSKYDHVALIMKFGDETWIFDAQSDKGVSLLKWHEFIDINDLFTKYYFFHNHFYSFFRVVYRKLMMLNKDNLEGKLFMFIAVIFFLLFPGRKMKIFIE